ncbi:MAG: metallophosphoesterase [Polyangiaceae bacterium]
MALAACAPATLRPSFATSLVTALAALGCSSQVNRSQPDDAPSPHITAIPIAVSASPDASLLTTPLDGGCTSPNCGAASAQRFVIIGDYGASGPEEAKVAELARSLKPDFVVTTGDNNYPLGAAETIDENVGRYFHEFIAPYKGSFGTGARENSFFPSLGNHDWFSLGAKPYLDFFSLPNNERYYDVVLGSVQLFALDSDPNEPDGTSLDSVQGRWFEQRVKASTVPWRVVYFHHPPYSSGPHGSTLGMRWPFREWGASVVFSGHDHTYERFDVAGFPYLVNGVGGQDLYQLVTPLPGSVVRHADVHGLVFVTVTATELVSRFLDSRGQQLDALRLSKP